MHKKFYLNRGGDMIAIDFQAGAHGNFLEFVCNSLLGITLGEPFDDSGASHNKKYTSQKRFVADHWSYEPKKIQCSKVVSIQISPDDLLPLQQISLLRAGNHGLDNDRLEINTYHKLNNKNYSWVLDNLLEHFFTHQVKDSYDAVKDVSWPEISTIQDFKKLPDWIQHECNTVHNLELLTLTADSPNCPRHVLREFFQLGFANPGQHGFIQRQKSLSYPQTLDVFYFPFAVFYDPVMFLEYIGRVADWASIEFSHRGSISDLHKQFLNKQPYINSKQVCNTVLTMIQQGKSDLPKLDLLQEAYVNAQLKRNFFQ